jgi:hypothetical protein
MPETDNTNATNKNITAPQINCLKNYGIDNMSFFTAMLILTCRGTKILLPHPAAADKKLYPFPAKMPVATFPQNAASYSFSAEKNFILGDKINAA